MLDKMLTTESWVPTTAVTLRTILLRTILPITRLGTPTTLSTRRLLLLLVLGPNNTKNAARLVRPRAAIPTPLDLAL